MMGASAISLVRLRSAVRTAELTAFCLDKGNTNSLETLSREQDSTGILAKKAQPQEVLS
jgi:hypothetical protein